MHLCHGLLELNICKDAVFWAHVLHDRFGHTTVMTFRFVTFVCQRALERGRLRLRPTAPARSPTARPSSGPRRSRLPAPKPPAGTPPLHQSECRRDTDALVRTRPSQQMFATARSCSVSHAKSSARKSRPRGQASSFSLTFPWPPQRRQQQQTVCESSSLAIKSETLPRAAVARTAGRLRFKNNPGAQPQTHTSTPHTRTLRAHVHTRRGVTWSPLAPSNPAETMMRSGPNALPMQTVAALKRRSTLPPLHLNAVSFSRADCSSWNDDVNLLTHPGLTSVGVSTGQR